MTPIYILLFSVKTGRFVGAHFSRSNEDAQGFARGVQTVTQNRRVYIWPRDRQLVNQRENEMQVRRANRARKADMETRSQEAIKLIVSTIDVDCDECPAKAGEFCKRFADGKWIRRGDGFHATRVAKAKGASNG